MRYLVAEGAIGPSGRRVRCANCGHQWVQEPETGLDEELFAAEPAPSFMEEEADRSEDIFAHPPDYDAEMDTPPPGAARLPDDDEDGDFQSILRKEIESTPIPEGVKPDLAEPVLSGGPAKSRTFKLPSGERTAGYLVAACIYLLLFGAILALQPQISRAWPPSNLLYDLVGIKPVPPGDGLALDGLHAVMADGRISMKGNIINLQAREMKVPAILASIVDDNEKVIDRVLIAPPIARIKPEGQIEFTAAYPKIPDGATDVKFAFSWVKVDSPEPVPATDKKAEAENGAAQSAGDDHGNHDSKSTPDHADNPSH